MTLLLDTHTLLWFVEHAPALSHRARTAIEDIDNVPVYSIASVWEMAIKLGLGKLAMSRPLNPEFSDMLKEHGFHQLDISFRHASEVAGLPLHHRDPLRSSAHRPGDSRKRPHRQSRSRIRPLCRHPDLVMVPPPEALRTPSLSL